MAYKKRVAGISMEDIAKIVRGTFIFDREYTAGEVLPLGVTIPDNARIVRVNIIPQTATGTIPSPDGGSTLPLLTTEIGTNQNTTAVSSWMDLTNGLRNKLLWYKQLASSPLNLKIIQNFSDTIGSNTVVDRSYGLLPREFRAEESGTSGCSIDSTGVLNIVQTANETQSYTRTLSGLNVGEQHTIFINLTNFSGDASLEVKLGSATAIVPSEILNNVSSDPNILISLAPQTASDSLTFSLINGTSPSQIGVGSFTMTQTVYSQETRGCSGNTLETWVEFIQE